MTAFKLYLVNIHYLLLSWLFTVYEQYVLTHKLLNPGNC